MTDCEPDIVCVKYCKTNEYKKRAMRPHVSGEVRVGCGEKTNGIRQYDCH